MTIYTPPSWQTDPQRVQNLMVVCGAQAFVIRHRDPRSATLGIEQVFYLDQLEPGRELAGLALWALGSYCGSVWLLPALGSQPDPHLDLAPVSNWQALARAQVQRARAHLSGELSWHELTSSHGGVALAGLVAQRMDPNTGRGRGMPLGIYAPWVNDAWGLSSAIAGLDSFPTAVRAQAFASGLALAAFAMRVQLRFSPSYSGLVTMRQELAAWEENSQRAIPELTDETRELLAMPDIMPTYLTWRAEDLARLSYVYGRPAQPLTGSSLPVETEPAPGLWVYDRNSSFPSSFRDMPLGAPTFVADGSWRQHVPGFYLVTGIEPPARWPAHIPGPFHTGEGEGAYPQRIGAHDPDAMGIWAWEPQLRLAKQFGWRFSVVGGHYWPREQVMDPRRWYDRFWNARKVIDRSLVSREERRIARALVKKMGVATIGRLNQRAGRALVDQQQAQEQGLDVLLYDTDQAGQLTGLVEVETLLGRKDLAQPAWWASCIASANERLLAQVYGTAWDTGLLYVDSLYTLRPHQELAGDANKPGGFRANGFIRLDPEDWRALAAAASVGEAIKYLAHRPHQEDTSPDGENLLTEGWAQADQELILAGQEG